MPTHGDWQPRNWLVHDDTVSVIDLGRADLRPAASDLARLAAQDFRRDPALEAAFLDGYGSDPRSPDLWHRLQVREAISTAVWAHQVGDERFEQQGHRMIAEALAELLSGRTARLGGARSTFGSRHAAPALRNVEPTRRDHEGRRHRRSHQTQSRSGRDTRRVSRHSSSGKAG